MVDAREERLGQLYEAGRRGWPEVLLSRERFVEHVAARAGDGPLDTLHGEDLFLACAAADGDARALAAFDARYMPDVASFLAGVESAPAAIEEVRQLVRERLFVAQGDARPKILEYSGRGSLGSWLRVVTLRVASNRRRAEKAHSALDDEDELLPRVDPELAILRAKYADAFNAALREAFAGLAPKERVLFRMHFLDGLNIDRIGIVFHVHRATVARWIAAAREGLLERTMAILGDRLKLDASEIVSLLAVVRSALDVSLQGLLAESAEAPR